MLEPIANGKLVQLFPVTDLEFQSAEDTDQFKNVCDLYDMKWA